MATTEEWLTAPTTGDDNGLILVSGRTDISKFRNNPKFSIRINISWKYADSGMPADDIAELMEQATDLLQATFAKDPVAVLTGIYTGEGRRDWVFYTLSTNIFGRKLNETLAPLPVMPLEITAENDPQWAEYDEMRQVLSDVI